MMMSPEPGFLHVSAAIVPLTDELCHYVITAAFAAIGWQAKVGRDKDKRNERRLDEALKTERKRHDHDAA